MSEGDIIIAAQPASERQNAPPPATESLISQRRLGFSAETPDYGRRFARNAPQALRLRFYADSFSQQRLSSPLYQKHIIGPTTYQHDTNTLYQHQSTSSPATSSSSMAPRTSGSMSYHAEQQYGGQRANYTHFSDPAYDSRNYQAIPGHTHINGLTPERQLLDPSIGSRSAPRLYQHSSSPIEMPTMQHPRPQTVSYVSRLSDGASPDEVFSTAAYSPPASEPSPLGRGTIRARTVSYTEREGSMYSTDAGGALSPALTADGTFAMVDQ